TPGARLGTGKSGSGESLPFLPVQALCCRLVHLFRRRGRVHFRIASASTSAAASTAIFVISAVPAGCLVGRLPSTADSLQLLFRQLVFLCELSRIFHQLSRKILVLGCPL